MFSLEQRRIALETYIKYDHSYTATVVELGYPAKETMRKWWKEYKATGEIPVGKTHRKSKYSDEQAQAAVNHYLEHGKSLTRTMRALGYPRGRETLCGWIDELAPGERKYREANQKADPILLEEKIQAVAELESRNGAAAEVAAKHGVSRTAPYIWRREIIRDNDGEPETKGEPVSKKFDDLPDDIEALQDMLRETKMQLRKVQLEFDARQVTLEIEKKTQAPSRSR